MLKLASGLCHRNLFRYPVSKGFIFWWSRKRCVWQYSLFFFVGWWCKQKCEYVPKSLVTLYHQNDYRSSWGDHECLYNGELFSHGETSLKQNLLVLLEEKFGESANSLGYILCILWMSVPNIVPIINCQDVLLRTKVLDRPHDWKCDPYSPMGAYLCS